MIGDRHIRRVKKDKIKNSFDNAKSFFKYFSGAKTDYMTHRNFEDFNVDKLADELINIVKI